MVYLNRLIWIQITAHTQCSFVPLYQRSEFSCRSVSVQKYNFDVLCQTGDHQALVPVLDKAWSHPWRNVLKSLGADVRENLLYEVV